LLDRLARSHPWMREMRDEQADGVNPESIREIIERNFGKVAVLDDGKPVEWRDDWVCKVGINYKAIADELNAALGGGECESCDTRWHQLFGTPERAARVIVALNNCRVVDCIDCWARGSCRYYGCGDDYDALLEWLRGDA